MECWERGGGARSEPACTIVRGLMSAGRAARLQDEQKLFAGPIKVPRGVGRSLGHIHSLPASYLMHMLSRCKRAILMHVDTTVYTVRTCDVVGASGFTVSFRPQSCREQTRWYAATSVHRCGDS